MMRATLDQVGAQGYFVRIPDISHVDFTDAPLWSRALRWFGLAGPKSGTYAHRVIDDYALGFFQPHLSGLPAPLLDRTEQAYPE